nr:hypothetical protein BaRGS_029495 [Batillaria attramentaria]
MSDVAEAVGVEVRGKHNDFVKQGVYSTHTGASCFSPVINIMRDSRWGRNQETYGEDPYLSGKYAAAYVTGLQADVETPSNKQLAVSVAMRSFVLLKNRGLLPLKGKFKAIGVVGPFANDSTEILGSYNAFPPRDAIVTALEGLTPLAASVQYSAGCVNGTKCAQLSEDEVQSAVTGTDVNFVLIGTGPSVENEDHDRADLELPGMQKQLLMDVMRFAPKTPLVVLLFSAGPVNVSFADRDERVSAILQCFFPAQATGTALRHVLLNDVPGAVPAGRLPYTWPQFLSQLPPMVNYSMAGRTYRYFDGVPLYPFGFGLSYSSFHYTSLTMPGRVTAGRSLVGQFSLMNQGPYDAEEVYQVYISWLNSSLPAPTRQLVYFGRISLSAGTTGSVDFELPARSMALWFNNGWQVPRAALYRDLRYKPKVPNVDRDLPHKPKAPNADDYPFRNVSLSWDERVADLVGRLTLEEIQEQMGRGGAGENGGPAPAIKRLDIGPYQWNQECLRGDVGAQGNATAFPQALGLAAAFRINGVPACANSELLTDVLRDEWNFTGYIVSDEGAIENIINLHHYLNNTVDTVAACVNAGCNLELSGNLAKPVYFSLVDAVNAGKLTQAKVQEMVSPLFYTRMRLGEFDPPEMNPYSRLSSADVETDDHKALAVEAAMKSFVLLKNDGQSVEAEGHDRPDIELPGQQKQLLMDVINNTPEKVPIILLLFNAGPVNISFADQDPRVSAIMECFFPAQATGDALRHVLLNDVDGAVVQVYIRWRDIPLPEGTPKIQLAWFDRISMKAGQSNLQVSFEVEARSMAQWKNGGWFIEEGFMDLFVGGQQPHQKRAAPNDVITAEFKIVGSKYLGRY